MGYLRYLNLRMAETTNPKRQGKLPPDRMTTAPTPDSGLTGYLGSLAHNLHPPNWDWLTAWLTVTITMAGAH